MAKAAFEAACEDFAETARRNYADAAALAYLERQRLEDAASLIVDFVDRLERLFAGLDMARDVIQPGQLFRRRSDWRRDDLIAIVAEGFDHLLTPSAGAVLAAACRVEALGRSGLLAR